uniref:ShKT domain-containing protein n=1 Tax=Odontella aurita TaxID=265563 RepID=A0A7S4N7Z9_9STRA
MKLSISSNYFLVIAVPHIVNYGSAKRLGGLAANRGTGHGKEEPSSDFKQADGYGEEDESFDNRLLKNTIKGDKVNYGGKEHGVIYDPDGIAEAVENKMDADWEKFMGYSLAPAPGPAPEEFFQDGSSHGSEESDEDNMANATNSDANRQLSSCRNHHNSCQYWASIGECSKNPGYMLHYCKESCGQCSGGSCYDNHRHCQHWASIGECSKNPGYMLTNCKRSCGRCAGNGGGSTSKKCHKKKVRIFQFCINGNADSGAEAECQIQLNGNLYYPKSRHDCRQEDRGFCDFREGLCHDLRNAQWVHGLTHRSMSVAVQEHDDWSENDSYYASLPSGKWHDPTCDPYEVVFSRNFRESRLNNICASLEAGGSVKGLEVKGGVQACTTWTDPAESFVWHMEVYPDN